MEAEATAVVAMVVVELPQHLQLMMKIITKMTKIKMMKTKTMKTKTMKTKMMKIRTMKTMKI